MCFYGFLRSGEVTLTSGQEFDPEADLSEGDVALDDLVNPTVVTVHINIWEQPETISAQWLQYRHILLSGAGNPVRSLDLHLGQH